MDNQAGRISDLEAQLARQTGDFFFQVEAMTKSHSERLDLICDLIKDENQCNTVAKDNVDRLKNRFRYNLNRSALQCGFDNVGGRIARELCDLELEWDIEGDDDKQVISVTSILPVRIPVVQRESVGNLIVKINGSTEQGHFDLNMETGRVCYESDDVEVHYPDVSPEFCWDLVKRNFATVDPHFCSIMGVGFGEAVAI